jgi:MOSC domain-containing protein YiiM
MGRIERILLKRAKGGPMDPRDEATLTAGRGIDGNADQGGFRQVTILSEERWAAIAASLGVLIDPSVRRANLVVSGVDLEQTHGRTLIFGECRLLICGETKPCEQMEEAHAGLQAAMRPDWGGGAYARVVHGGTITVGDSVTWAPATSPATSNSPES